MIRRFGILGGLLAVLAVLLPGTALAYPPVDVVHQEKVQVGPYTRMVGFSDWPLRADKSLDFVFEPVGGREGMTGKLAMIGPDGTGGRNRGGGNQPLVRHPRKQESWGLDVFSLNREGAWTFKFQLDGPQGHGEGELKGLQVLEAPGPPFAVSWAASSLPLIALLVAIIVAVIRIKPGKRETTWAWR